MSTTIKPMLATLVDKPVERPGWSYEIKWDAINRRFVPDRRCEYYLA